MDTIHDVHSIYQEKCWFAMSMVVYCSLYLGWIQCNTFPLHSNYTKNYHPPPCCFYHTVEPTRYPRDDSLSPHRVAVASRDALLQDTPGKLHSLSATDFCGFFLGSLEVAKCQTNYGVNFAPIRLTSKESKIIGKKMPQLGQNPKRKKVTVSSSKASNF